MLMSSREKGATELRARGLDRPSLRLGDICQRYEAIDPWYRRRGKPDILGTASLGLIAASTWWICLPPTLCDPETNAFYERGPDFIAAMETMTGWWTEHGVVGGLFLRRTGPSDHTQTRRLHKLIDMWRRGRVSAGGCPPRFRDDEPSAGRTSIVRY
jgi:hypothetical protein